MDGIESLGQTRMTCEAQQTEREDAKLWLHRYGGNLLRSTDLLNKNTTEKPTGALGLQLHYPFS